MLEIPPALETCRTTAGTQDLSSSVTIHHADSELVSVEVSLWSLRTTSNVTLFSHRGNGQCGEKLLEHADAEQAAVAE